jgi:hypothetical protein
VGRILSNGFQDYEIIDPDALMEFRDVAEVEDFLRGFLQERDAVDFMLQTLEDHGIPGGDALPDEEVLRAFGRLLLGNQIRLVAGQGTLRPEAVLALDAQAPATPSEKKAVGRQPKEPSDAKDVNAEDQADTLKRAAEEGKPFCEECEKAKQEEAQRKQEAT